MAIVVLSFGAALGVMNLIDYWRAQNVSQFERALTDAGLTFSESITGGIDTMRRNYIRQLVLEGWAYDRELGQPLSVLIFLNGKLEQIAITKGARAAVTKALGLSPEQTKDVVFSGRTELAIDCTVTSEFTIIAVSQGKKFAVLGRHLPIPGCPV